jgi:hypothetical protein
MYNHTCRTDQGCLIIAPVFVVLTNYGTCFLFETHVFCVLVTTLYLQYYIVDAAAYLWCYDYNYKRVVMLTVQLLCLATLKSVLLSLEFCIYAVSAATL